MESKLKMLVRILFGLTVIGISACGGGGGDRESDSPEISNECVLGKSTIGNCKI